MSPTAQTICYLIAFICFVAMALVTSRPGLRENYWFLLAIGLAAWVFVPLVIAARAMS